MIVDFGSLPPEINSGKLYSGPGSASMLSAAAAWNELAAELRSLADSYGSVISHLASQSWCGPTSAAMAAAAAPYVAWMNATAAQAEQTADQAVAAASAYETAFAMTVPPPVVAANRAQLASLIATNVFGQNAPAIAATEAQYSAMWAQDAAAMYDYAGQSAAATKLVSFTAPPNTTDSGAPAAQAAAVTQATSTSATTETQATLTNVMSSIPTSLQSMATPATATTTSTGSALQSILDPNANFWNTVTSTGAFNPSQVVTAITASTLGSTGAGAIVGDGNLAEIAQLAAGLGPGTQRLSGVAGSSMSAELAQAASIGHLSVPPAWTASGPPLTPLSSAFPATPLDATPPAAAGMSGIAPAGQAGRGAVGAVLPDNRFLARPPMVPSWSSAG